MCQQVQSPLRFPTAICADAHVHSHHTLARKPGEGVGSSEGHCQASSEHLGSDQQAPQWEPLPT